MTSRPWAAAHETHTAAVFFAGDRAYKVKKPVDLGFVDFRTREARRQACEEEVRLNRRLAPDVYLGVADVVDHDGELIDHLVVMRRMPDDRRLSTLVAADAPSVHDGLRGVARALAGLHEDTEVFAGADSPGAPDATAALWQRELEQVERLGTGVVSARALRRVRALVSRYLAGRRALFDERLQAGLVRDGHGDLLADDIFLLDDGPRILDCLEFDRRLRIGDVWFDAAFLAMDLEHLGRPDLARQFLDAYAEFSGTTAPASLVHLFIAYRAHVRAKVALVRRAQGKTAARRDARRLLEMCRSHLQSAAITLTLVGGLPGSGKSTLAGDLASRTDAVLLSSDVVRASPTDRPGPAGCSGYGTGRYAPEAVGRTYAELLERARVALGHGESVVLDASWRAEEHRAAARAIARDAHAALTQVRVEVPDDVAEDWLRRRRGGASEATVDVRRRMRDDFATWPESIAVDPRDEAAQTVLDAVGRAVLRGSAGSRDQQL